METESIRLELEGGLAGILCEPVAGRPVADGQVPAVLMLHGFGGHKDEVGDLYKKLAERLALQGIASLRFDFRGWGDSAGDMADTTVSSLREDAQTGLDYLSQHEQIDATRLGLLGFSLGGATALLTVGEYPDKIKSLVTWSSVGDLEKDFRNSMGNAAFETASREGVVELDLGWREVRLNQGFFESLTGHNLLACIQHYPGAFFTIAGTEDFSAQYIHAFYKKAAGEIKDRLLIPEADHIFNVFDDGSPHPEHVLQATSDWFEKTL